MVDRCLSEQRSAVQQVPRHEDDARAGAARGAPRSGHGVVGAEP